jgi:hypothetical protein
MPRKLLCVLIVATLLLFTACAKQNLSMATDSPAEEKTSLPANLRYDNSLLIKSTAVFSYVVEFMMTKRDRENLYNVFESVEEGYQTKWANFETKRLYTVVPLRTWRNNRIIQMEGGDVQQVNATCRTIKLYVYEGPDFKKKTAFKNKYARILFATTCKNRRTSGWAIY